MIKPDLYDIVELLLDLPEYNLRAGALGAIVHQHTSDVYEVEFADDDGKTLALCALSKLQFLVVWRQATQSWVSLPDQMAELVVHLGEPARREVLDFARFLHTRSAQQYAVPSPSQVVRHDLAVGAS